MGLQLELAVSLLVQLEMEFTSEPKVQLAPAQQLAPGLKLMLVLCLALQGPVEVTLAPALAQLVQGELKLPQPPSWFLLWLWGQLWLEPHRFTPMPDFPCLF